MEIIMKNMKNYVCVIFTKDDKIFCCRSINNPNLWEFPHSEKEHYVVYESMMSSLKEEILNDFNINGPGIYYPYDENAHSRMDAELSYVNDENIVLAHKREGKWITANQIDDIQWDSTFLPIAKQVKIMLAKQQYKITELNPDETEEIMWEDYCSQIKMNYEFRRLIHEQAVPYREGKIKWRQIRVYNGAGELIATES